ncbi:hypothetical protein GKQ77_01775 [Streptomyces sp. BG9H]|uniref:Secreted protein n=1 Tax=Streptomyces anatolicus TaxID=2675858 RepID=A0ABS6YGR1_9ACTN|nr:hypothetical protein [Streptomyces anatolicus]MBW5420300.1 hypothetical protein [Streptomyces anatolicus]
MHLRRSATAALGALALVLAAPTSASAADGQFRYTYLTEEGYEAVGFLNNPPSGQCINLHGVGSDDLPPGHSPKNRTDATAVVFLNADCEGDVFFSLRPHTGGGSERLKVRSVVFS